MIPNDALINALRSLGFEFKKQCDRVNIWKKAGSTLRSSVRRNAYHSEEYAESILRQAGMPDAAIRVFIAQCRTGRH